MIFSFMNGERKTFNFNKYDDINKQIKLPVLFPKHSSNAKIC